MSTNPYKQLRTAAETALALVSGVKRVQGLYNGEDWPALSGCVARDGSSVWTRVTKAAAAGDGPSCCDCAELYLHVLVGANATAERPQAAGNAEQIAWDCYGALKQSKHSLAWLHTVLLFAGMEIEFQSPNCTIVSLLMRTSADLADWTE